MRGKRLGRLLSGGLLLALMPAVVHGTDAEVLRPRVPADQREIVRGWGNPFPSTPENVEKGRALYHGKAFCVTCHGREGQGLQGIAGLVGPLPRNFTDRIWQATRSDGELFWILKNGSPGTDMASFVPLVLTEKEAWQVLLYVRSFGHR
jgi:mono/diheme cytochrome c family protein